MAHLNLNNNLNEKSDFTFCGEFPSIMFLCLV